MAITANGGVVCVCVCPGLLSPNLPIKLKLSFACRCLVCDQGSGRRSSRRGSGFPLLCPGLVLKETEETHSVIVPSCAGEQRKLSPGAERAEWKREDNKQAKEGRDTESRAETLSPRLSLAVALRNQGSNV